MIKRRLQTRIFRIIQLSCPLYNQEQIFKVHITTIMSQQSQSFSTLSTPRSSLLSNAKRQFFVALTLDLIYSFARLALILTLILLIGHSDIGIFLTDPSFQRMQETIQLWQKQVIVDFRVTQTLNCPEHFQQYTNDHWPGIVQGCACSTKLETWSYDIIFRGRCSEVELQNGCISIAEKQSILFTFWKQSMHLCVRRLKNYNFYSKKQDIWNYNQQPQKQCGQGTQFQIDLITGIKCPVTTVVNQSSLSETISGLGFSFQRSDDYPIVEFVVAEHRFCEEYSQNSISPGRQSNYILERSKKRQCSSYDSRTIVLDEQDQISLMESNPRILNTIANLPAYPHISYRYRYQLGFRRYPAWSYSCRMGVEFGLKSATEYLGLRDLLGFYKSIRIAVFVILCFQLLYIVLYWGSAFLYHREKQKQGYLYLKDYQIKRINPKTNIPKQLSVEIIKFLAIQIITAILFILVIAAYSKTNISQLWYHQASKCTSSLFQTYLSHYQQFFGGLLVKQITSIFVAVGLIAMDFAHLLWRRWKGDLQELQDIDGHGQNFNQTISQYKLRNLSNTQIQITQECLVANAEDEQDKDLAIAIFGIKATRNKQVYFEQSSQYSENQSKKSD